MKHPAGRRERIKYWIDNTFTSGSLAIIVWLAVASAALVLTMGALIALTGIGPAGAEPPGFAEATWSSLMRTLDPGTMGSDTGWSFRFAMLLVTLGGIFVISTLIGVITSGIEQKLEELGKGRSRVVESNHTVVLGWSPAVFTIVGELVVANENQRKPRVVVMGQSDKTAMEDALRSRIGDTGNTRVICRTGSPIEQQDLDIASIDTSKSIIIVTSGDADGDAEAIKALLAITRRADRRPEPYHVVAAIRRPRNLSAARIAGGDEAQILLVSEFVARILAQTCRQPGLSTVYSELLDFKGDEIYFRHEPTLIGKSFHDALLAYEDCAVIGLAREGQLTINPDHDTIIAPGCEIIAIAEDDDKLIASGPGGVPVDEASIASGAPGKVDPERTLLLGWNWRAPSIIHELDAYVAAGSEAAIVSLVDVPGDKRRQCCDGLRHLSVSLTVADTTDRDVLESLSIGRFDHVVLLAYSDDMEPQRADSRTLMTLLHLRDLADALDRRFTIVTEVMDIRNRELAKVARADDFVVSDRLVSQAMTQLSENQALGAVFSELFEPRGSEIYLKPAGDYVFPDRATTFYTVVESASRQGQVAIGYQRAGEEVSTALGNGVVINPPKLAQVEFDPLDRVIVLAEK